jgi:ribosomal-protein-alanine N-acetyltransferase
MILEPAFISSTRLSLRLGTKKDVPEIINFFYRNQEHLSPWQPLWHSTFLTQEFWQQQVEENIKEFQGDRSLKLFIFKATHPTEIIGQVNFNNFGRGAAQFCYLGYSLAEIEQGKGYMAEALQAAINYVFKELNMHRVMANYIPQNQRSGNVLKRLGFVVEGYAREYLLINGQWQDHILTSLTNKNWQAQKS